MTSQVMKPIVVVNGTNGVHKRATTTLLSIFILLLFKFADKKELLIFNYEHISFFVSSKFSFSRNEI
jgi:hypothetical protein